MNELKMKYLVIENKEQEADECLYDIADFFWDNGNEVYISHNYSNKTDYQNFIKQCDWIVLLKYEDCSSMSFFKNEQEKIKSDFKLEKINNNLMLVFSIDGVYSNAIPFPHKIFHFDKLDQYELKCFFNWCRKLNLFG
jgi:hypothetical protein